MTFPGIFLSDPSQILVFFAVSFAAAAVNSVAGGGTFLTFPVFILNGLTSAQANVMSTIALWPGNLASVYGYKGEMVSDAKRVWRLLIIGCLGGALGAVIFLHTPEFEFKRQVPWLMLAATLIFTFGRHAVNAAPPLNASPRVRMVLSVSLQLAIALYGGYFGAGIGILTLAMLQIMGHTDIHRMNALKTLLTASVNAVTAFIFVFSGTVIWPLALVMVTGAVCGGYCGARMALKVPPHYVRTLVSVIGFSMTIYFFVRGV